MNIINMAIPALSLLMHRHSHAPPGYPAGSDIYVHKDLHSQLLKCTMTKMGPGQRTTEDGGANVITVQHTSETTTRVPALRDKQKHMHEVMLTAPQGKKPDEKDIEVSSTPT